MSASDNGLPQPQGLAAFPHGFARTMPQGFPRIAPNQRAMMPPGTGAPDTLTILKALQRRWAMALSLGLVAAAIAGVAAWFLLSPRFTVTAQLLVSAEKPKIVPRNQNERETSPSLQRTQVASIKRRDVLTKAVTLPEVKNLAIVREQPDPVLWLLDELLVKFPEGSEIIDVSITGDTPDQFIPLLNGLTKAYLELTVEAENAQRLEEIKVVGDKHTRAQETLRKLREQLDKRMDETGKQDGAVVVALHGHALSEVGRRLREIDGKITEYQATEKKLESQLKGIADLPVPEAALADAVDADPEIKKIVERQGKVNELIGTWAGKVPDDNRYLVEWRGHKSRMDKELEAKKSEIEARILERARARMKTEIEASLAQVKDMLPQLTEHRKTHAADQSRLEKEIGKIGHTTSEMGMLRAEIEQASKIANRLADELGLKNVEVDAKPRVQLYQSAAIQKKDIKRQVLATIAAPVATLVGVCFCVGWWEFRARRIHSVDEVVQSLGLPLVGAVPAIPQTAHAGLGSADQPLEHHLIESVDAIRTLLLREATVSSLRVVMVTSATSGEGKTTLAGHLAVSLARAGRRTLLIDCDLRRPSAHQLFEQTLQPGLSEVLLKEVELAEAVRPTTTMENLSLLPAGEWDREVLKAMAQDGFAEMLQTLRSEYDFIVVDSSPVLAATDSLVIGQYVDGVLLSLLRDVSQVPPVNAAAQRLSALGIRVLGAVVNGLSPEVVYSKAYQSARPTMTSAA